MFTKKMEALKAKEMIQAQSTQLETAVAKAWRTVSKLHIPKDALLEAKIRNIIVVVCNTRVEVARVQFELKMKIIELGLES